jgi:DNA invertase Pin-like site-specific DNA recombinase
MMGVFAEFERALIQERIKAGIERARQTGTKSGQAIGRPKASQETENRIRQLRAQGLGINKIAAAIPCGVSVVQRVVAASA